MHTPHDAVDSAISELDRLRKTIRKRQTRQVSSPDEQSLIKATALTWFNNHLTTMDASSTLPSLSEANAQYREVVEFTDRATSRSKYDFAFKALRATLVRLRGEILDDESASGAITTEDAPPDLSPLVRDPTMQAILEERWVECTRCIEANAPLASTVMMGSFLEALLLARLNHEPDKKVAFSTRSAPVDRKTSKKRPLQDWTLHNYLDIGHELEWISRSAKDVGEVVRDYRNYVHPYKQASHSVRLDRNDARLFWEIVKEISRQLISSSRS